MQRESWVFLGRWMVDDIDAILNGTSRINGEGERIAFLSSLFVGVPYREHTLKGSAAEPEVLTVNLEEVDCFTLLDYVEAMRRAASYRAFIDALVRVRYRGGKVRFLRRNHFFTDWREANRRFILDATASVGADSVRTARKRLNVKDDGSLYLEGLAPKARLVRYIPTSALDADTLSALRTGDYIGVYSTLAGLDVSHTGIAVWEGGRLFFRHASSLEAVRRVVDQDFLEYVAEKPGIVVLRARERRPIPRASS